MRTHLHARELVVLDLVSHAIIAMREALRIEHETMLEHDEYTDPPTLVQARSVDHIAAALQHEMGRYRRSVYDAIGPVLVNDDDIPF